MKDDNLRVDKLSNIFKYNICCWTCV